MVDCRFFRTYSPQGDGNVKKPAVILFPEFNEVFQNLFPARGRKLNRPRLCATLSSVMFFRTYSPQGDGNDTSHVYVANTDVIEEQS